MNSYNQIIVYKEQNTTILHISLIKLCRPNIHTAHRYNNTKTEDLI